MIAPWKHRPDIATDQMQAEREAPDVIERACRTFWGPDYKAMHGHFGRESMEAAIRVVLADMLPGVSGPGTKALDAYIRGYAASIDAGLTPTSEDNQP